MVKYGDWTVGETEAILNMIGGIDVARSILRGHCKLVVQKTDKTRKEMGEPALTGSIRARAVLEPLHNLSMIEAIRRGGYSNNSFGHIIELFESTYGDRWDSPAAVEFVQFNRTPSPSEVIVWLEERHYTPMMPAHLLAFGIGNNMEPAWRSAKIVALGGVQRGYALMLEIDKAQKRLHRDVIAARCWPARSTLFGIVVKS